MPRCGGGRGRGAGLAAQPLGVLLVPGGASTTSPLFRFVPKLDRGSSSFERPSFKWKLTRLHINHKEEGVG